MYENWIFQSRNGKERLLKCIYFDLGMHNSRYKASTIVEVSFEWGISKFAVRFINFILRKLKYVCDLF